LLYVFQIFFIRVTSRQIKVIPTDSRTYTRTVRLSDQNLVTLSKSKMCG